MPSQAVSNFILAVCTLDSNSVGGSGPIFYCKDEEELQKVSLYLEKILDAMAHELRPGTMILVKH